MSGTEPYRETGVRDFPGGERPRGPNAGGPGLIPGWGTRSYVPQLKTMHASKRDLHLAQNATLRPSAAK